jgi:hypothetical protein
MTDEFTARPGSIFHKAEGAAHPSKHNSLNNKGKIIDG